MSARLLRRGGWVGAVALAASAGALAFQTAPDAQPKAGAALYAANCAGCHGANGGGGRGPALTDAVRRLGEAGVRDIVLHGRTGTEMPAFQGQLSGTEIAAVSAFLHAQTPDASATLAASAPALDGTVVRGERQAVRLHVVADGLNTPWGLAFLPDGRLLVTERSGGLRVIDRGVLSPPVAGTPTVWTGQDAGMLDVGVAPGRAGWIYLAHSERNPTETGPATPEHPATAMTVIVRGKLDAQNRWTAQQTLFRAPPALYTVSGSHYGSRFLFDGAGHVFFSLGDRGDMRNAQDLASPLGKVHRVNLDGSVPADNPFVRTPGAVASIWSWGHRNPEGFAVDPATGLLWESEHGPNGGDEINVIERGRNYGWGVVSMGVQPGIAAQSAPGMEPPIVWYTPSIAPSGIGFYGGTRYPGWRGSLFVCGLRGQQLRRLEVEGRRVVHQEVVLQGLGRVRAVATGPDGLLYLLIQRATGQGTPYGLSDPSPGTVVRLDPVS